MKCNFEISYLLSPQQLTRHSIYREKFGYPPPPQPVLTLARPPPALAWGKARALARGERALAPLIASEPWLDRHIFNESEMALFFECML
jgi:hypothetical protein